MVVDGGGGRCRWWLSRGTWQRGTRATGGAWCDLSLRCLRDGDSTRLAWPPSLGSGILAAGKRTGKRTGPLGRARRPLGAVPCCLSGHLISDGMLCELERGLKLPGEGVLCLRPRQWQPLALLVAYEGDRDALLPAWAVTQAHASLAAARRIWRRKMRASLPSAKLFLVTRPSR